MLDMENAGGMVPFRGRAATYIAESTINQTRLATPWSSGFLRLHRRCDRDRRLHSSSWIDGSGQLFGRSNWRRDCVIPCFPGYYSRGNSRAVKVELNRL